MVIGQDPASGCSKEHQKIYQEWFTLADSDGDGSITGPDAIKFFGMSKLSRPDLNHNQETDSPSANTSGNSEERNNTAKKRDVFRPSVFDRIAGHRDRCCYDDTKPNSDSHRNRWRETEKEHSDMNKMGQPYDDSKQYVDSHSSPQQGSSHSKEGNYDQRRDNKWNARWGPSNEDSENWRDMSSDSDRKDENPCEKVFSHDTGHGKEVSDPEKGNERDSNISRSWNSSNFMSCGTGGTSDHLSLAPQKPSASFGYSSNISQSWNSSNFMSCGMGGTSDHLSLAPQKPSALHGYNPNISRSWNSSNFVNCGMGGTFDHLSLAPQKPSASFGYSREIQDSDSPNSTSSRRRFTSVTSRVNSRSSRPFHLGILSARPGGASRDSERYSRMKLLEIYRTTDVRNFVMPLDGTEEISLWQEDPIVPLALIAPNAEEAVIFKGIERGDVTNSSTQACKDNNVEISNPDVVPSEQSNPTGKEDQAGSSEDFKGEITRNTRGMSEWSSTFDGNLFFSGGDGVNTVNYLAEQKRLLERENPFQIEGDIISVAQKQKKDSAHSTSHSTLFHQMIDPSSEALQPQNVNLLSMLLPAGKHKAPAANSGLPFWSDTPESGYLHPVVCGIDPVQKVNMHQNLHNSQQIGIDPQKHYSVIQNQPTLACLNSQIMQPENFLSEVSQDPQLNISQQQYLPSELQLQPLMPRIPQPQSSLLNNIPHLRQQEHQQQQQHISQVLPHDCSSQQLYDPYGTSHISLSSGDGLKLCVQRTQNILELAQKLPSRAMHEIQLPGHIIDFSESWDPALPLPRTPSKTLNFEVIINAPSRKESDVQSLSKITLNSGSIEGSKVTFNEDKGFPLEMAAAQASNKIWSDVATEKLSACYVEVLETRNIKPNLKVKISMDMLENIKEKMCLDSHFFSIDQIKNKLKTMKYIYEVYLKSQLENWDKEKKRIKVRYADIKRIMEGHEPANLKLFQRMFDFVESSTERTDSGAGGEEELKMINRNNDLFIQETHLADEAVGKTKWLKEVTKQRKIESLQIEFSSISEELKLQEAEKFEYESRLSALKQLVLEKQLLLQNAKLKLRQEHDKVTDLQCQIDKLKRPTDIKTPIQPRGGRSDSKPAVILTSRRSAKKLSIIPESDENTVESLLMSSKYSTVKRTNKFSGPRVISFAEWYDECCSRGVTTSTAKTSSATRMNMMKK